jgi:hypothetical protein
MSIIPGTPRGAGQTTLLCLTIRRGVCVASYEDLPLTGLPTGTPHAFSGHGLTGVRCARCSRYVQLLGHIRIAWRGSVGTSRVCHTRDTSRCRPDHMLNFVEDGGGSVWHHTTDLPLTGPPTGTPHAIDGHDLTGAYCAPDIHSWLATYGSLCEIEWVRRCRSYQGHLEVPARPWAGWLVV